MSAAASRPSIVRSQCAIPARSRQRIDGLIHRSARESGAGREGWHGGRNSRPLQLKQSLLPSALATRTNWAFPVMLLEFTKIKVVNFHKTLGKYWFIKFI